MTSKFIFFFFNDTATTEIYTLSLHDALPICCGLSLTPHPGRASIWFCSAWVMTGIPPRFSRARKRSWNQGRGRSEEHTSELQSRLHLVCRLLLEKKKKQRVMSLNYLAVLLWN